MGRERGPIVKKRRKDNEMELLSLKIKRRAEKC